MCLFCFQLDYVVTRENQASTPVPGMNRYEPRGSRALAVEVGAWGFVHLPSTSSTRDVLLICHPGVVHSLSGVVRSK